jgi:hypothetical protein
MMLPNMTFLTKEHSVSSATSLNLTALSRQNKATTLTAPRGVGQHGHGGLYGGFYTSPPDSPQMSKGLVFRLPISASRGYATIPDTVTSSGGCGLEK